MGGDKSAGEINDAQVERDVEAVAAQYDLIAVAERIDESAMEMVLAHELGVEYGFTPTSSTCPSGSPATRTRALRRSRSRSGPTRPGPFGSATVATIPAAPEDDVASGLLGSLGAVWRRAHACLGWFQRVVRALHMALHEPRPEDRVRAECNSGAPSVLHVASRVRLRVYRPTGGRHGHTVSPGSGRAVVVEGGVVGGCMMGTLPSYPLMSGLLALAAACWSLEDPRPVRRRCTRQTPTMVQPTRVWTTALP